jgi:hypothetical protein
MKMIIKNLTIAERRELFGYMNANYDEDASDGVWQCLLEDAAEEWGKVRHKKIDGYDAFIAYLEFRRKQA